ncbi:MAG: YqgE/AlgH family protein, partial [Pseudomonadota bacterium]
MTQTSESLIGHFLVATPDMTDPRFHKALIYMCMYNENGAFGLVVNHTSQQITSRELFTELEFENDAQDGRANDFAITVGGPVE